LSFLPIVVGLATALCWGTSDFLSRLQSEKVGHYNTNVYMHVATLLILLLLIPLLNPAMHFALLPIAVLAAAGVLNFLAFIALYRAFHRGVVSVVAPVAYTYPAVTTVVSVVVLVVVLSTLRLVAIIAIILGVVLLSMRYSELRNYSRGNGRSALTAGVVGAVISSVAFGVVYVVLGYATPTAGYFLPIVVVRAFGTLAGLTLASVFKARILPSRVGFSSIILIMGTLETIGFLSFNFGVSLGADSLPIVTAISGIGGAVAAVYGMALLKERLELNQLLGAFLSVAGVFALLYFEG
jgi:drug/metabolite transporter (DMT)-like permease